ncbi:TKL family protein kinase [Histomonas meleagridis]|uniref:TKL family protein kinase n=1 Tax=Histomonas meleagridis TaxID=135588 RepID=UPI00355964A2|nr:TKL family protein kinase [Histomonas meleagridis]KAH0799684.1 TKL family protein kinase [Histomonas meleagridis]
MKTCYPDQEDYIEIEFQDKLSDMSPFEAIDSALQSLYFSDRFGANSSDSYKPSLLSNTFSTQLFQKIYNENIALNEKVNDLTEEITELKEQFARYQQEDHDFKVQAYKIQELEKLVFDAVNVLNTYSFMKNELHIPLSMTDGGIFSYLINSQETVFSRSVIPSQSSGDVYCVINKNDPGNFSTGSSTKEYIKFLFPYPIRITGFSIQSSYRSFLRTWKVKTYDEDGDPTTIFRTKNDQSLNGEDKKLDITLDKVITTNKVKIIKKGYNWSKTKFVRIKNFELFSDQPEFIGGVFANMIKRANGDPHRADVYITSSNFDFRRFHKLSPSHSLCTLNDADSSWFQCELTKGKAVVQGYRLQFLSSFPITKYSIQGSNDLENWTVLDRVSTTKGETALLVVRECHSMQPFKYIRFFNEMVLEEKKLRFRHFDIFGVYLPE